MPAITISDVTVQFPFTPYDSQKVFMSKVIEALKQNQNALLESPTGTGKTLCLLCASLAWLEMYQANLQFQMSQSLASGEEMQKLEEQLKAGVGAEQFPPGFGQSRVRIIYASRTHTQLSQVMNELKRTSYSGFRTAIIASRDQLCIHPNVSKETSNQAKQAACRVKVQTRQCHYYNNVEKKKDLKAFKNPEDPQSNILDIEDLKQLGNKHKCCPYYLTRAAAKDYADIIFMPYNYLIDPAIRKRHGIDLDGAIVIFDEAHNLAQIAEESSSVELTASDIASALLEIDVILEYLANFGKENLEGDNFQSTDNDNLNFELLTEINVCKVKAVLLDVEKELVEVQLNKDNEFKSGGNFMFELLAKAKLGFETYLPIYQIVDAAIAYLTSGGYSGIHNKAFGLGKFANFLKVVFESDSYNISKAPDQRKAHMSQFYRVYVHNRDPPKNSSKKNYWGATPSSNDPDEEIVPATICVATVVSSNFLPRPFPVTLENPHVISPSQISVSVVKQGPESVILNSNYQNRSDPKYHTSLGYAIMQIAKAVPNGMLVFFPSYHIMRMIVETWNTGHIMQCIQRYKQMFIEPTDKEEFQLAMEQYYAMVNDATANGAIFCGVCRGKVSEGLDFVDKNGRAVVITGIPYAPAKDPRVVMKKSYLDQQLRDSTQKQSLTGSQWYSQQASRAVNQAIGRVIRHRFDYGAILLLDTRFSSSYAKEELPAWVKSHLVVHDTFSSVIRTLNKFFTTVPALVEERKAQALSLASDIPSGKPKISLNNDEQTVSSKLGLSARSLYMDSTAGVENIKEENTSTVETLQPVRKKIKMQMILGIADSASSTPPDIADSASSTPSLKEVNNPHQPDLTDKNQEKLQLASEALQQCRKLLAKEKFINVKSSLLRYHKSKDIKDMSKCISILLEQEATHHVIARFRDLISTKQQTCFDELETELRTAMSEGATSTAQTLTQSSQSSAKSRYAATLSLFTDCKKKLTSDQNKQVKTALLSYRNKGSVEELYKSISLAGIDDTHSLLTKLRVALRDADKPIYDNLIENRTISDATDTAIFSITSALDSSINEVSTVPHNISSVNQGNHVDCNIPSLNESSDRTAIKYVHDISEEFENYEMETRCNFSTIRKSNQGELDGEVLDPDSDQICTPVSEYSDIIPASDSES